MIGIACMLIIWALDPEGKLVKQDIWRMITNRLLHIIVVLDGNKVNAAPISKSHSRGSISLLNTNNERGNDSIHVATDDRH